MLAREWNMLLHEGASPYLAMTHKLIKLLQQAGMNLELYPMLRLRYETWDALGAAHAELILPPHLASFFGRQRISSAEFAAAWRAAVDKAERFLTDVSQTSSPRALLAVLQRYAIDCSDFEKRLEQVAARRRSSAEAVSQMLDAKKNVWRRIHTLRRPNAPPSDQRRIAQLKAEYRAIGEKARHMAASPSHRAVQAEHQDILWRVESLRQQVVSDAVRTIALEVSNRRPAWWWFIALDKTGRWLQRLAETAHMRLEPLGVSAE
jgi:hypothetical protein